MKYFWMAFLVVTLDQWTKWLIIKKMDLYTSIPVIDPLFYITSHRNRGAAFGILQNERFFFITITFFAIIVLSYYIWKLRKKSVTLIVSLALILGGAIGNFMDRIRLGEVIDFLDFRFGVYHFPVFNLADSAIVIGVGVLICLSLFFPQIVSHEKDKGCKWNQKS